MIGKYKTSRDARRDLVRHFAYLSERGVKLGRRFLRATLRTYQQLADMPGLGGPWEFPNVDLAHMRVWPVRGFKNFLIFYFPTDEGIEVARVLHGSQDIGSIFADQDLD